MDGYIDYIISRLTIDDMNVLGILYDNDATAIFKSMKKIDVSDKAKLTEANFRKAMYRLNAIAFIEIVAGNKEHTIYITNYGVYALQRSLEGVDG